jgi:hypothetical protein
MTIEQQEAKIRLAKLIDQFFTGDETWVGLLPDNITETMTSAAFSVLMAVKGTNEYFDKEGLLKED